uniref:Uncharacterized protein n=2 Tax=Picea TaxID=3328 RepID=A0A117NJE2_PICGL|nr:hypothetical protein ABT39_MTgene1167 [Picea glauca]QHR91727.1 hypothetical protein Q903MT_gene5763 [Picea sitchensis]
MFENQMAFALSRLPALDLGFELRVNLLLPMGVRLLPLLRLDQWLYSLVLGKQML